MGRHAERSPGTGRPDSRFGARRERSRFATIAPVAVICLLLIGAVVLGIWWWNIRSVTDPIEAAPVDAYAQVVSSPACSAGGQTLVRISGIEPPVTASLSGCGFARDQRLAVQYLAGHPEQARLTGSSVAGGQSLSSRLLPIGILAAGLVAVLATVALLVDRRRSRHAKAAARVTVAQLRSRAAPSTPAATPGWAAGGPVRSSDHQGGLGSIRTAESSGGPAGHTAIASARVTGQQDADSTADDQGLLDPARVDGTEPAHLFPSGFVMIDEQLFTHSGPEAVGGERVAD